MRRPLVLLMLVLGLLLAVVPGVSAASHEYEVEGNCSSLSGTVTCLQASWTYPDKVHVDSSFFLTVRVNTDASSVGDVVVSDVTTVGGCSASDVETLSENSMESRVWSVDMNGSATCSWRVSGLVIRATGDEWRAHLSGTTTADPDSDVATASFAPGAAMPFLIWGVVLVWAMYERLWLVGVSATGSILAIVAALPWATPLGITATLAALWMHYGSRSLRVRDDTEDKGAVA